MAMEPDFYQKVYEVVCLIPEGRVTSYGAIAKYLSVGRASRMVGMALNHCDHFGIPAHRVVNRNGMLSGKHHFPGTNMMQDLLETEGTQVKDDVVVDFKKRFWDPSAELL